MKANIRLFCIFLVLLLPCSNHAIEAKSLFPKKEEVAKMICQARVIRRDVKKVWLFNGVSTDNTAYDAMISLLNNENFIKLDVPYGGVGSSEFCVLDILMKDNQKLDVTIYGSNLISIGKVYYLSSDSKIHFSQAMYHKILGSKNLWAKYSTTN